MRSVYLCGPINGKSDAECNDWRSKAKHLLGGSFVVIDPMSRDFRGNEDMNVEQIVNGDIADIDSADFVLVRADCPSWGTAMEVRHAFVTGKKIVAFTEAERISPWLRYHTHAIYDSVQRACMAVINFDVLVGNKGDGMGGSTWFPASETGEGQSGLRTERVTLELTLDARRQHHLPAWNDILRDAWALWPTESVRVVADQRESHLEAQRGVIDTLTRQRDSAIRERDELRTEAEKATELAKGLEEKRAYFRQSRDDARTACERFALRVADLESQLESVACRAADAEKALGDVEAPWSSEPLAWAIRWHDGSPLDDHLFDSEKVANIYKTNGITTTGTVVPLYAAPPPVRGWLTAEERRWIAYLRDNCFMSYGALQCVNALLARSTPPEVVLPKLHTRTEVNEAHKTSPCLWLRHPDVIAALAAAGVTWKEANRE